MTGKTKVACQEFKSNHAFKILRILSNRTINIVDIDNPSIIAETVML